MPATTQPEHGQRPTIADVARHSGLAKSTISKALNYPPDRTPLSKQTRDKALRAAEELGYRPAWTAQALRLKSTQTIALLHWNRVPEAAGFWQGMLEVLVDRLAEAHYDLQVIPNSDRAPELLRQRRFDGCVIAHRLRPEVAQALASQYLPAVLLNADEADESAGLPSVRPDDFQGGLQLAEYLLSLGHERFAFVDNHKTLVHSSYTRRLEGLREAVSRAGRPDAVEVYSGPIDHWVEQWCGRADAPTAVVTYDDAVAMPLLSAFWQRGVQVPRQVSVATFNDTSFTRHAIPALTTIQIPTQELATHAASLLLAGLSPDSNRPSKPRQIVVRPQLIVRQSTGAALR